MTNLKKADYPKLKNIIANMKKIKNQFGNDILFIPSHLLNGEEQTAKKEYNKLEEQAKIILNNNLNLYITNIIKNYKGLNYTSKNKILVNQEFQKYSNGLLILHENEISVSCHINNFPINFRLSRNSGKNILSSNKICSLKGDTLVLK